MTEIVIVLGLAVLLGLAGFLLFRSSSGSPAPRPPRRAGARRRRPTADRRSSSPDGSHDEPSLDI